MTARTRTIRSPEQKAEIVAALDAGMPWQRVEKRFKVKIAQVYKWRSEAKQKPARRKNGKAKATIKTPTVAQTQDFLLALSLDESIRLVVRDELTKLAELRDRAARGT